MPSKERAERRRKAGKCSECGRVNDRAPFYLCSVCLPLHNTRTAKTKAKNKNAGKCTNCGKPLLEDKEVTKCINCMEETFSFKWD